MERSNSNIKKPLIFSQKKSFLIFHETEAPPPAHLQKKILMFQEAKLSYISGNRNPKNLLYFRK